MTDFQVLEARQQHAAAPASRPAATIRRSPMAVGPVSDAAEREADEIAERVLRAVADGPAGGQSAPEVAPSRIRRSAAAPVIRRKVGSAGDKLKGSKIRQISKPAKIGTILSSSSAAGPGEAAPKLDYEVDFGGGVVEKISGDDADYEMIPEGSGDAASSAKSAAEDPAAAEAEALRQRNASIDKLKRLIDDLGQPLTGYPGANLLKGPDHADRKDFLKTLQQQHRTATKDPPGPVPGDEQLSDYAARATSIATAFKGLADAAQQAAQLKRDEQAKAKAEAEAAAAALKETEAVDKANIARAGKGLYGPLNSKVSSPQELAALLALTPRGEEGALLNCLQHHDAADISALLGKRLSPKNANTLLGKLTERPIEQLTQLLGHVGQTQPEVDALGNLLERTAPDKTTLAKLLEKVGNNAVRAWRLMAPASQGSEASVLAMLDAGRSEQDTASLVSTPAGKANTADAATVSKGVVDPKTARTLLEQPGVSGTAQQAVDLLAHKTVGGDIAVATRLLGKHGNAADALALIAHGCTLADTELLLATTGITGGGTDAAWCLQNGCSVADLVTLLNARSAKKVRGYREAGFAFTDVSAGITARPTQEYWAGETCAAPAFSGPAASLDAIIARAGHPPVDGGYSGGNRFGNHGGVDDHGNPVMFLPAGNYREYDLKPYQDGVNRGTRRMVVGGPGNRRYYTDDHYQTFKRFA